MNKIEEILSDSIKDLIENSSRAAKIKSLESKHTEKLHFIPYKYRIYGGILQSMNIQFGNFIEKVMEEVVRDCDNNEIIEQYSGKKSNSFKLSKKSDAMIDAYITNCQINNYTDQELQENYTQLLKVIKENELDANNEFATFKHDVDLLFREKDTGNYYYIEIKYNDDHDTGKFIDINRKLLKTYAFLQRELGEGVVLNPILFYFNNKKKKGNIYLPESLAIYRGKRFFERFSNIAYDNMDAYMKGISESPETLKVFNALHDKIINS